MTEIRFLNIDLDLEYDTNINLLVDELGESCTIMRSEIIEGIHHASFETGELEIENIIQEYANIVERLSPSARKLWIGCTKKSFNFGFESGTKPKNFHASLSGNAVSSIFKLGGGIDFTIYPHTNKQ